MEPKWEGCIAGTFEGYAPGRVYTLDDGSRWRQQSDAREYVYRERAKARLLWNQSTGRMYLDVEGTSGCPWVTPGDGKRVARI